MRAVQYSSTPEYSPLLVWALAIVDADVEKTLPTERGPHLYEAEDGAGSPFDEQAIRGPLCPMLCALPALAKHFAPMRRAWPVCSHVLYVVIIKYRPARLHSSPPPVPKGEMDVFIFLRSARQPS